MKKICLLLVAICLPAFVGLPVNANKEEHNIAIMDDNDYRIFEIQKDYCKKHNVNDISELTKEQVVEMSRIIDDFKLSLKPTISKLIDPSAEHSTNERSTVADLTEYSGDVFVTMDARTIIVGNIVWEHGHAGVGGFTYGSTVEALNPQEGVKYYPNRLNQYWRSLDNGGIYKIDKAVNSEYLEATEYAISKEGERYGFNSFDPYDWYCSELVYYAWKQAGYDIDSTRVEGTFILPSHLMNDGDTVLAVEFPY